MRCWLARLHAGLICPLLLVAACDDSLDPLTPTESQTLLAAGNTFSFTTIDAPGAVATFAQGINAKGDIVGSFRDANGVHGFLLRNGAFTTIDYPGAAVTEARGINSGGEIIGTYRLPGEPGLNFHGFKRTSRGEFVKVDYPGHTSTIAQRILDDGTVLGCRHDHDFMETMRGIIITKSSNSGTDAFASMHNGATPDRRRVVGLYTNMMAGSTGRTEGYVIDNGEFKPFLVPGSTMTAAWDVNPRGDVTGVYRDAAGTFHGFVLTRDGYLPVDAPGASATRAFGINSAGEVVGAFVDASGNTRGFLARRTR